MGRRLEPLEAHLVSPPATAEELRSVGWALSDAHLSTFGVHELAVSRYELLWGLQGARGVLDTALLGKFLDTPAAYSSAGRQAFRRQKQKAIRSAALVSGRRQGLPVVLSPPSSTPATGRGGGGATQRAAGRRGRSRGPAWPSRWRRNSRGRLRSQVAMLLLPPFEAVGRAHGAWAEIGSIAWLVRQLRFGPQLPWRRKPPRSARVPSYDLSPGDLEFACGEVQRWMTAGFWRGATTKYLQAIRLSGRVSPGFITTISRKLRIVVDYSVVNRCLEERTFRMDQLSDLASTLHRYDCLFKADIHDAY
jgi:hypothetical protein